MCFNLFFKITIETPFPKKSNKYLQNKTNNLLTNFIMGIAIQQLNLTTSTNNPKHINKSITK